MNSPANVLVEDQLMSRAGKTFHLASRLLPKEVRPDVVRLYAFCRHVDDLADDNTQPVQERRRSLERIAFALERAQVEDLRAAGWPFVQDAVMSQAAALLVRAALDDLKQQQPRTELELLAYAFGVAGTVGVMMARVLRGAPQGFASAVALGMAMQLSNICRDVREDFQAGRTYLPQTWVTADELNLALHDADRGAVQRVAGATRRTLVLAASLYEVAYDGIWSLPWRIRWSILAAAMCYREIGIAVGKDVERSWQRRTVVSGARKLWLILLSGVCVFLPRFWRSRSQAEWPEALGTFARTRAQALGVAP